MEGLRKVGDPVELAIKYFKDGADEIFYDDIVASLYNRKYNIDLIKRISSNIHIPLLVSGGIKIFKITCMKYLMPELTKWL